MHSTCDWEEIKGPQGETIWQHHKTKLVQSVKPHSETYLMEAAIRGNIAFLVLYLKFGGSVSLRDSKDLTAMHYACANGNDTFVSILCQFQAELEAQDRTGATPIFYAVRYAEIGCIRALLAAGCNLNHKRFVALARTSIGGTEIHVCTRQSGEARRRRYRRSRMRGRD